MRSLSATLALTLPLPLPLTLTLTLPLTLPLTPTPNPNPSPNPKQAAANTGAKISETGALLDNAQSNVGMPADSLIDKIGRSLRERSGSVGANGKPSTVWQGKQKASVPFQQKQPPTQKTKQADDATLTLTLTLTLALTLTRPYISAFTCSSTCG